MEKSPAELLGELDDYDRGFRKRKLLFTALPVVVMFAVYAVMVNAVLQRSTELDAKQAELATTEADLAKRKQELATVASELAIVRGQYDEVQKANDEAKRRKQEVVATLEQAGSAAAKVEKLEELLTTAPKPTSRAEAMSLWKQGYDAFNAGRKDEARALYERARDADPTYAAALNSLGRIALDDGDLPLADDYFTKALAANPTYVAAIHNRALVAKKQGRAGDARALTEQALKLRPGYQPSTLLQGDLDADVRQQTQQTMKK